MSPTAACGFVFAGDGAAFVRSAAIFAAFTACSEGVGMRVPAGPDRVVTTTPDFVCGLST